MIKNNSQAINHQKDKKRHIFKPFLINLIRLIDESFFPKFCVNCRSQDDLLFDYLCGKCAKELKWQKTPVCYECGEMTSSGEFCKRCGADYQTKGIIFSTRFHGPAKELIHWFKYEGYFNIGRLLAGKLAEKIRSNHVLSDAIIVPVPMNIWKKLERGYNQTEVLANMIRKDQKIEVKKMLTKTKNITPQMKLKRKERLTSVVGRYKISKRVKSIPKKVILLDDVCTTGATLNECARVLKEAGVKEVWGLVVAKD